MTVFSDPALMLQNAACVDDRTVADQTAIIDNGTFADINAAAERYVLTDNSGRINDIWKLISKACRLFCQPDPQRGIPDASQRDKSVGIAFLPERLQLVVRSDADNIGCDRASPFIGSVNHCNFIIWAGRVRYQRVNNGAAVSGRRQSAVAL